MERPKPTEGVAYVIGTGLLLVVTDAGPFYYWLGVALIALGAVSLTPWGNRLR